jgi:ATP-binding cassette subfamily F protein 3
LRQSITKIDQRLTELTNERLALEQRLAVPMVTPADIAAAGKQLKLVNEEITRLEDDWLEYSDQLQTLEAQEDNLVI